jgi:TPR repeat protein
MKPINLYVRELIYASCIGLCLTISARAGENRDAETDYTLGMKYYIGTDEIDQDVKQAVEWFRKAAELGLAKGQYRLGQAYDSGQGVRQDYPTAMRWYLLAAGQDDRDAESALGDIYAAGHGVKINNDQAAKWYYKAAEQGVAHAQSELGKLYFSGTGVKQDFVEAYFWLGVASKEIDDAVDKRDEAGERLTPAQLSGVRHRIETWRPEIAQEVERSGKL